MEKRRFAALLLAAAAVLVVLSASVFIISHADHDCNHDDCPVCEAINLTVKALRAFIGAAVILALFALFCGGAAALCGYIAARLAAVTPITLRVKLSN